MEIRRLNIRLSLLRARRRRVAKDRAILWPAVMETRRQLRFAEGALRQAQSAYNKAHSAWQNADLIVKAVEQEIEQEKVAIANVRKET